MKIVIYTVSHFLEQFPLQSEIFTPVVVGDGVGLDLANNNSFAEMRAHYEMWKTSLGGLDWVGFQHYRRHLTLPPQRFPSYIEVCEEVSVKQFERYRNQLIQLDPTTLNGLLENADVYTTAAWPWQIGEQFADFHGTRAHRILDIVMPEHWNRKAFGFYPGNMYLMRTEVFNKYMTIWKQVVDDFLGMLGPTEIAGDPIKRIAGCVSERIFSYWIDWQLRCNPKFRLVTCPHIFCPAWK